MCLRGIVGISRCGLALLLGGLLTPLIAPWGLSPLPAARADCGEIDPLSLVPADGTCDWSLDGTPQTAYTVEELTVVIDGAAYLYEQHGFAAAAFQNYAGEVAGEPAQLSLSLFNQGTSANAVALFADPNSGYGTPILGWPGSGTARYRTAFGFLTLDFHEACFFVSIVVTAGGDAALPEASCLAAGIINAIQQATPVEPARWGALKAAFREGAR